MSPYSLQPTSNYTPEQSSFSHPQQKNLNLQLFGFPAINFPVFSPEKIHDHEATILKMSSRGSSFCELTLSSDAITHVAGGVQCEGILQKKRSLLFLASVLALIGITLLSTGIGAFAAGAAVAVYTSLTITGVLLLPAAGIVYFIDRKMKESHTQEKVSG